MIEKLTRRESVALTNDDADIFARMPLRAGIEYFWCDRADAEIMFARVDAAHDTGVPATVSQIIRTI